MSWPGEAACTSSVPAAQMNSAVAVEDRSKRTRSACVCSAVAILRYIASNAVMECVLVSLARPVAVSSLVPRKVYMPTTRETACSI